MYESSKYWLNHGNRIIFILKEKNLIINKQRDKYTFPKKARGMS